MGAEDSPLFFTYMVAGQVIHRMYTVYPSNINSIYTDVSTKYVTIHRLVHNGYVDNF